MHLFSLSSTPILFDRRDCASPILVRKIRTSVVAPDWRRSRNERANGGERRENERKRDERDARYVALLKLARRQAFSSIFFSLDQRRMNAANCSTTTSEITQCSPSVISVHTFSLLFFPACVALLSYNAIYTGVVKVRIMSLRFYRFYPPPPFAREYDRVTSAALRNYFFIVKENGCSPRVYRGYF